jgi:hypothetical protein
MCTLFQPLRGSVFYANRILGQGSNSEGETVLTCIGIQYAMLCCLFERCLKMLQNSITCFKSFIYPLYDSVCLFYFRVVLPEAEMVIGH